MKSKLDVFKRALEIMIEHHASGWRLAGVCIAIDKAEREKPCEMGWLFGEARRMVRESIEPHYTVSGWLREHHPVFVRLMEVESQARWPGEDDEEAWSMWLFEYRIEWLKQIIDELERNQS